MKVLKTIISDNETSAVIDLFSDSNLSESQKKIVRERVGDFLLEQTLVSVANEKSPIQGENWKKSLDKQYKKEKEKEIGNDKADLQFSGRLLDQTSYQMTSEGIKIGTFGERAVVADGHCNLSGESKLPKRRFIPAEGQEYIQKIQKEVDRIVADVVAETALPDPIELKNVSTKSDLKNVLQDFFGQKMTLAEIRLAIYRNPKLYDLLDEANLLDLI